MEKTKSRKVFNLLPQPPALVCVKAMQAGNGGWGITRAKRQMGALKSFLKKRFKGG